MFLSQLPAPAQQRVTVSKFSGYDARPRTALGAFRRMENLTGDGYPTLSVRGKRKTVTTLERPNALTAKDCLIWVEGGTLYINGAAIDLVLTDGEKQLVSMGAYLLIWPDKNMSTHRISAIRGAWRTPVKLPEPLPFPCAAATERTTAITPPVPPRRQVPKAVHCGWTPVAAMC